MKLKFSLAIALAALAGMVEASITDDLLAVRRARTKSVKMGVWHADLVKAKAYAEANGMPLIAVWSNGDDCSHCQVFEQMVMSPVFTEWMKTSGYAFYFGVRNDGIVNPPESQQEGYHGTSFYWCRKKEGSSDPNASRNWPYVRIYWKKTPEHGGRVKVDMFETGAALDGEYDAIPMPASRNCTDNPKKFVVKGDDGTYNPSARYFINKLTNSSNGILKDYVYDPTPPYRGGEFGVPDVKSAPLAGLQLERGGTPERALVPLTRTNSTVQAYAATNTLVATYPSGYEKIYQVNWSAGDKAFEVSIAPKTNEWDGVSKYISLELYEGGTNGEGKASGKVVATNWIEIVDKVENSPKNPLWIGAKTADKLGWGEWTMDLEKAKEKVKASADGGNSAYTLVLIGGPLWCPDCVRLEKVLIESKSFKDWTKSQRIACVAVDLPRIKGGGTSPTLLNREVYNVTSSAMKNWGLGGLVSGAGYLSRKGKTLADAAKIQERNLKLIKNDTEHGGLRLPEPAASAAGKTGDWEAGVPCLVMLRPDGTVSGRIYQFSNSTAGLEDIGAAKVLERIKEMCSQASEKVAGKWAEENNDSVYATKGVIESRNIAGISTTLSFVDQADYYRINAPAGTEITFDLENVNDVSSNATLCLSVVNGDLADPDGSPVVDGGGLTVRKGKLGSDVFSALYQLPSSNCFVKVFYELDGNKYPVDPFFGLAQTSTLCNYRLSSYGIVNPAETEYRWVSPDDDPTVIIRLVSGQEYVFTGIDPVASEKFLEYHADTGRYTARDMEPYFGLAEITATDKTPEGKYTFTYQKWVPGFVGFERVSGAVNEPDGEGCTNEFRVAIRRTGGISGVARVKLELVPEETTSITNGTLFVWNDQDAVYEVENAGLTTNTVIRILANPYANNNERVTIRLVELDGSDAKVERNAGKFTLTIKDSDVANPGMIRISEVNGAAVPSSGLVVAEAGSDLTVALDRIKGVDGSMIALLTATGVAVDREEDRIYWQTLEAERKFKTLRLPEIGSLAGDRVQVTLNGLSDTRILPSAKYVTVQLVPKASVQFTESRVSFNLTKNVLGFARDVIIKPSSMSDFDKVTVRKLSGSVAPGIGYELVSSYEFAGALRFTGTPTKDGSYTAVFQLIEAGVAGHTVEVTFNVTDCSRVSPSSAEYNPHVATTRTFDSILISDNDNLVGVMTLTLPPSGRASAKVRELGGESHALLAVGWSSCVNGDYSVDLERVGEGLYTASVSVCKGGAVNVTVKRGSQEMDVLVTQPVDDATTWSGAYTVSLPISAVEGDSASAPFATGAGYMTLRMSGTLAETAGTMVYAGMLPNGRFVSGSSTLVAGDGFGVKEAALPVISASTEDSLAAVFVLNPSDSCHNVASYAGGKPLWSHQGVGGTSFGARLEAFGCLYVATNDFVGCCCEKLGCSDLTFFAQTDLLPGAAGFGDTDPVPAKAWTTNSTGVRVIRKADLTNKFKLIQGEAAVTDNGLTLAYSSDTGIVNGSLRIDFKDGTFRTAKYRGVVMPGWGAKDCADCADSCADRPFISGACWFDDDWNYTDDRGRSRATRVTRGCPFSVGVAPGK